MVSMLDKLVELSRKLDDPDFLSQMLEEYKNFQYEQIAPDEMKMYNLTEENKQDGVNIDKI